MALFFGAASTMQLSHKFATGMNGDEDLAEDITMKGDKFHYVQNPATSVAQAAAKEGSGVRARWVELKDCN